MSILERSLGQLDQRLIQRLVECVVLVADTATVVATRRYALATVDGHELRSDTRSTFQLRAVDGTWMVESVRFDAAR